MANFDQQLRLMWYVFPPKGLLVHNNISTHLPLMHYIQLPGAKNLSIYLRRQLHARK